MKALSFSFNKVAYYTSVCVFASLLTACNSTPANVDETTAPIGGRDQQTLKLDNWVDKTLTPYLQKELATNTQLAQQPILIVAMNNGEVLPQIDGLRSHIRTRLSNALISTGGINLINRSPNRAQSHHRSLGQLSCQDTQEIRYYVGIDVQQSQLSDLMNVSVRAVDAMANNAWLTGFGLNNEMGISKRQVNAAKQSKTDEYLRGLRVLPFNANEPDLLANYMAHNLSCLLQDKAEKGIKLTVSTTGKSTPSTDTTFNLIESYLTRFDEVSVAGKPENANTFLKMALHPVDTNTGLYLMSADIERIIDGKRIGGLATQSYMFINSNRLRDQTPQANVSNNTPAQQIANISAVGANAINANAQGISVNRPSVSDSLAIIEKLAIVTPKNMKNCTSFQPFRHGKQFHANQVTLHNSDCFTVNLTTCKAANVYLLHEGSNGQIHRMQPTQCNILQGSPAALSAGEMLQFPDALSQAKVIELDSTTGKEAVYAIAITNQKVANSFAALFKSYPDICDNTHYKTIRVTAASVKSELIALKKQYPNSFDWQMLTINHIKK